MLTWTMRFLAIIAALPKFSQVQVSNDNSKCQSIYEESEYALLANGSAYIPSLSDTIPNSGFVLYNTTLCYQEEEAARHFRKCVKWSFDPDEFEILENDSALVFIDRQVIDKNAYAVIDVTGELELCVPKNISQAAKDGKNIIINEDDLSFKIGVLVGLVGSGLSVVCLTLHLVLFALLSSLRNIPGYNLASMSIALLLAYTFMLIGQIPEVLGVECVVTAYLEHYFFLASFCWMNVMAFDVCRMLRMSVTQLICSARSVMSKKFLLYSLYSWGLPMLFSITLVIVQHSNVPHEVLPGFGLNDVCWFQGESKIIFFIGPAFTLILVNTVFFGLSAYTIWINTMKDSNELHKASKRDFGLYFRMGLIMGTTWSSGIVAYILGNNVVWHIFEALNCLQGLFVFLLFTCSKKNWNALKEKIIVSTVKANFSKASTTTTSNKAETGV